MSVCIPHSNLGIHPSNFALSYRIFQLGTFFFWLLLLLNATEKTEQLCGFIIKVID